MFSRISRVLATPNLAQGTGEAGGARTPHYGFVGVEVASGQRLGLVRSVHALSVRTALTGQASGLVEYVASDAQVAQRTNAPGVAGERLYASVGAA